MYACAAAQWRRSCVYPKISVSVSLSVMNHHKSIDTSRASQLKGAQHIDVILKVIYDRTFYRMCKIIFTWASEIRIYQTHTIPAWPWYRPLHAQPGDLSKSSHNHGLQRFVDIKHHTSTYDTCLAMV